MRDQWEYKILNGQDGKPLQDEDRTMHGEFNQAGLNALGKEGWEICGYNWSSLSRLHVLVLKRKIISA